MWILAAGAVFVLGCGKKSSEPEGVAPSASAPVVATFEPPPAAPTASEAAPVVPTAVPVAPKPPDSVQIKSCCGALHAAEAKATPKDKIALQTAAGACDGIAKLVASGTTKHADAITSIRATMKGAPLPSACR